MVHPIRMLAFHITVAHPPALATAWHGLLIVLKSLASATDVAIDQQMGCRQRLRGKYLALRLVATKMAEANKAVFEPLWLDRAPCVERFPKRLVAANAAVRVQRGVVESITG